MEFLQSCDPRLAKEVVAVKNDIAYLSAVSGILAKFKALNLSLHGTGQRGQFNPGKVGTIWVKNKLV